MAGLLRRLIHSLTEPLGPEPGTASGLPARRISSVGQIALGSAITLAGVLTFHGTRAVYAYLASNWQPCLSLPADGARGSAQQQVELLPSSHISRNESLLLHQYRQTQLLTTSLTTATSAQQLRLNQQLRILTHGLDSFCRINNHFRSEQAGLLLVGTWSASVAALSILLMAPQGVQNTNRTERTIFISTAFVLGISISLLSFMDPETNASKALRSYSQYNNLLQALSSSLANQQLLLSTKRSRPEQGSGRTLSNPTVVAELISNLDIALMSIPDPTITVNGDFAESTFSRILNDKEAPGEATQPAGSAPENERKAEFPGQPSPP